MVEEPRISQIGEEKMGEEKNNLGEGKREPSVGSILRKDMKLIFLSSRVGFSCLAWEYFKKVVSC